MTNIERVNATEDFIPEIVKNEVPTLRISNIVLYVHFRNKQNFSRFFIRPFDDPDDPTLYLIDITNFIHDHPGCLILDNDNRRIFLKEEFIDEAIHCDKSLPDGVKRPPEWEWNATVEKNEYETLGILSYKDVVDVEQFVGVTINKDASSIEPLYSQEGHDSNTQNYNDVGEILRKIKENWTFAFDQNGDLLCNLHTDSNSLWLRGIEPVHNWGIACPLDRGGYLEFYSHKTLLMLIKGHASKTKRTVISAERMIKNSRAIYINNGKGKYYEVSENGVKEDSISQCPVAFIGNDDVSRGNPYEIDISGTEMDFLRLIDRFNLDDSSRKMLKAWMISIVMYMDEPMPIALFQGTHGTGKSISMNIAGKILQPELSNGLTVMPHSSDGLRGLLSSSWLNLIDNVRFISSYAQDLLSMSSTGGYISQKKLYTNNEVESKSILGPVMISTTRELKISTELTDRMLTISSKSNRYPTELSVSREDILKARMGLLKIISTLYNVIDDEFIEKVEKNRQGRFPHFFRVLKALECVFPHDFDKVVSTYNGTLGQKDEELVPQWISMVVNDRMSFEGSATEVVKRLDNTIGDSVQIPTQYRIVSEWNKHEWYWGKKMNSSYSRTKSKRTWHVWPKDD